MSNVARLLGLVFGSVLLACSSDSTSLDGGADGSTQDSGDAGSGLIAVPLTACSPLAYTAQVSIGATQTFRLFLDTGSATVGVAGAPCTTCNVSPRYAPGATAKDTNTTASTQFAIGNWSGEIYQDTVGFAQQPSVAMKFVSITTQQSFFQAITCGSAGSFQGVLGFARAPEAAANTDSFLDRFVAAQGITDMFATQLCDNGGTLWLGGFDPAATTAAPQYTPFNTGAIGKLYYAADLESISVGGTSVSATIATPSFPDTVFDTGTSAIFLPTAAVNALTSAIAGTSGYQQVFGGDGGTSFVVCATVTQTKAALDAMLPPLTLTFGKGAAAITVQALATESYLYPRPNLGWCSAFYESDPTAQLPFAAILGGPILRSNVVIFDRANGQIGFAPHVPCGG